jgi:methionyl-tRNA synthetase
MNDMEASNATKPEGLKSVEPSKSVIKNAGLPLINNNNDASPHHRTEFAESPISSVSATAALNPIAETLHPITAHHPEEAEARPETPQIAIDDFIKIDLRVAQIVVAERIPKADKLLRLEVDLGYERRQILSGIAQWYTPEELIGRRIVVIANLAPRKMRGLESHGMLLAASQGDDGKPVLATFGEDIALGSRLK